MTPKNGSKKIRVRVTFDPAIKTGRKRIKFVRFIVGCGANEVDALEDIEKKKRDICNKESSTVASSRIIRNQFA
jgi:hypothetical protein